MDTLEHQPLEVVIIGAGLCGLALALGLHQRGIRAHVFERVAGFQADTATGISIGPNGRRALDGIRDGLSAAMRAAGSVTKSTTVVTCRKAQEPTVLVEKHSGSVFMIKWRTARQILADLVPISYIHFSHTLINYTIPAAADGNNEGVDLVFETRDGPDGCGIRRQVKLRAKLVVGADGINSAVRKTMVGDLPRDLHLINWNALVYNPDSRYFHAHEKDQISVIRDGPALCHLVDAGKLFDESSSVSGDKPTICYLVDVGEGYTMWVFRVQDYNEELAKNYHEQAGRFGDPGVKTRVLQEIDKLGNSETWKPLRAAVEATVPESIFERRVRDLLPLKSWSDLDGQVLLIGDAAHAMHWGPGQGARTAFEDAHQLTQLLSDAFSTAEAEVEVKRAVRRFEEIRIPRTTRFQSFSAEATSLPEFLPDWVKKLSPAERSSRCEEFKRWVTCYPDKMTGDPDSTYFK